VDLVAIYAAAVATLSLLWQTYSWHLSHHARLTVHAFLHHDPKTAEYESRLPSLQELREGIEQCTSIREHPNNEYMPQSKLHELRTMLYNAAASNYAGMSKPAEPFNIPNVIVLTFVNKSDLDIHVSFCKFIRSSPWPTRAPRRQIEWVENPRELLTVKKHALLQHNVWLYPIIEYSHDLSKALRVEINLWSGKKIKSNHFALHQQMDNTACVSIIKNMNDVRNYKMN
jgi:hypothetical protein